MGNYGREQTKEIFGKFGHNLDGEKREREFQGLIWVSGRCCFRRKHTKENGELCHY